LLIAAAMKTTPLFESWSFTQVLLLLVVPAGLVHWAVLCRFLKLRSEPGPEASQPKLQQP
jgi:hypothetical protein